MISRRLLEQSHEVIVAPATPPGRGALALLRISGPSAFACCRMFLRPLRAEAGLFEHRRAVHVEVVDGPTVLDRAVAVAYHAPHSYTGQDVLELSVHGNPLLVEEVLNLACRCGARLALPGEFTFRAVLAGKMDLVQAEAVEQVVSATSRSGAEAALRQLGGVFSRHVQEIRELLLDLLTQLEMAVDFPEEDDVPVPMDDLGPYVQGVHRRTSELRAQAEQAHALHSRSNVVICGPPNVGKSTLFNALTGTDRAIVSPQPGTTRDTLFAPLSIGGSCVDIIDTAGIRLSQDNIEAEGVQRAWRALEHAVLALVVFDATHPEPDKEATLSIQVEAKGCRVLLVYNKRDLCVSSYEPAVGSLAVSALTGEGVPELREAIHRILADYSRATAAFDIAPTARQRDLCCRLDDSVRAVSEAIAEGQLPESVTIELRTALRLVGQILGEETEPDVLNAIFSRFCVGK